MSGNQGARTTNLDEMSVDQLEQVKQQEEQRMQALTQRYAQLRGAAARISASRDAVAEFASPGTAVEGSDLMIPLTPSLYVPAKIRDPSKLLVELGTGFYAEKSPKETKEYLDRKNKIVDANSENMTKVLQMTKQNLESVGMAMQGKMMEIRAKQEGQRYKAQMEN